MTRSLVSTGVWLAFSACGVMVLAAPEPPPIRVTDGPKVITFGIDARDYNEIAAELAQSILSSGKLRLDGSKVLTLGPVDTDACIYRFDERTLQEKLQTILHRSDKLQVTFAVDAMKESTAAQARYNVMQLQWAKESVVDPEALRTYGSLAKVDYILFGRVSAQTTTKGKQTEVTYTFNWKLGNCENGLLVWTDEGERSKKGDTPALPEWVACPRGDSALWHYQLGSAERADSVERARAEALRRAEGLLLVELNKRFGATQGIILPIEHMSVLPAPGALREGATRTGHFCWILGRVEKETVAAECDRRLAAQSAWTRAEALWNDATATVNPDERTTAMNDAQRAYADLLATYPIGAQHIILSEFAAFRLAEIEKGKNNPWAARTWYERVRDHTTSASWRNKASELLKQLVCDATARETFLWRREFDGRRVVVASVARVDGKPRQWPKLQNDLGAFLHGVGAITIVLPQDVSADTIAASLGAHDKGHELLKRLDVDFLIVAGADGRINQRNAENSNPGKEYQFDGTLHSLVLVPAKTQASAQYAGRTGWNPIGEGMCLDLLALHALKKWKEGYLEHLEARQ